MIACLFLLGTSAVLADTLWTATYGSPYGGDDAACAVLTDTFNNTTVVGSSAGASGSGGSDFVVIKYSWFHGNTMWTKRITGSDSSDDVARGAGVDPAGRVCVTGQTGQSPNYNILTVQLDANGNEVWRATYDGTTHADDAGTAIATDTSGSVFVTGYAENATTDYVTMMYNWDGTRAWATTYDGGGADKPTGIALGPDGSVYVTGRAGDNFATVKYSSSGVQQWVATYTGPFAGPDWAVALAVDSSGNAYVTGVSRTASGPGGFNHISTLKYDSAGARLWDSHYNSDNCEPADIALGPTAVYVTGQTPGSTGGPDFLTIACDLATGDTLWARLDSGPTNSLDAAAGIAVGSDSSIWVAGTSNNDFLAVLYTPDGVEHAVVPYISGSSAGAVAIALDKNNKVAQVGNLWAGSGYDILTVKFDTLPLAVAEPRDRNPLSALRLTVAPNPAASGRATLSYGLAKAGAASVTVAGVDGRVVLSRSIETNGTNGTYPLDLRVLDAGVYIVRLESGGRAATQKLVIGQ